MSTLFMYSGPLLKRAVVLGALAGAALVLISVFSTKGPLVFVGYAALFAALAPLLARYRSEGFAARTWAGLAAFSVATLIVYVYLKIWVNPVTPHLSLLNVARFGFVFGCGAVLAAAVAYVTGDEATRTPATAA